MKRFGFGVLGGVLLVMAARSKRAGKNQWKDLERQFRDSLSGATLAGRFTGHGRSLSEEKYTIEKVTKLTHNLWLFHARIQYDSHDLTVPLPLGVKWAGDTPVITLTDVPIPGLGTYTARVLIYRNQYAGTWSGHGTGGHLFGNIIQHSREA